ncbi:Glycosyl hydrolases family 25 protein [Trichomonas vaginalis G3]|uniref:N,O-diacetylmuramidase n=1 Tax=Trichomonas vaginalis (strain ATCC PRA-98 / G3) TaxID=412133 RepID=A2G653_TRIV3|nr:glycosyl hydrolase [Trichomonas vaginalis G3]EAX87369.1 Glycosyl hydrolases family 25 protein [Trichomonas vaginalis G3]KAI5537399.1 gh25 lytc-like domain-containing protein [Trichomonas vaginalis G3]|eukprot:XP_001300299.1 glycosyl hydrolase [Trichomonas vaginalis G3]
MNAYKIIDVSVWQGNIDFNAAKVNSGIQGVMIRAGFGSAAGQEDKQFANHMREAIAANILIGAYHYGYARTEAQAIAEADFCAKIINPYKSHFRMPVAYDDEDATMNVGKVQTAKNAIAFCNRMKAYGYKPMVYCNLNWARNYIDMSMINAAGIEVWIAQYNSVCQYTGPHTMWQYTNALKISGYSACVDGSWVYKNY